MSQRITVTTVREAFAEMIRELRDAGHETDGIVLDDRGPDFPYRYAVVYGGPSGHDTLAYVTESWPGEYRKGRDILHLFRGIVVGATWDERQSHEDDRFRNR